MFTINTQDKSPIYLQIMEQLVLFISTGVMDAGEKLPSIRELASELGINPNTVARAYAELEQRGVIETIPKKGAFVTSASLRDEVEAGAKQEFGDWISKYSRLGVDHDKLKNITEEAFDHAEHTRLKQEL
ncbi:MAG: GntR family transcriptional regulator [Clostridia bacterium]|nr:GntR family transcriptional regulator [Clostridia bacterium]